MVVPEFAIKGNCRQWGPTQKHPCNKALVKGRSEQHSRVCSAGEDQSRIRYRQKSGRKNQAGGRRKERGVREEGVRRPREQLRQLRQKLGGSRLCRKEQRPRGRSQQKRPKPPLGPGSCPVPLGMQGPRTQGAHSSRT